MWKLTSSIEIWELIKFAEAYTLAPGGFGNDRGQKERNLRQKSWNLFGGMTKTYLYIQITIGYIYSIHFFSLIHLSKWLWLDLPKNIFAAVQCTTKRAQHLFPFLPHYGRNCKTTVQKSSWLFIPKIFNIPYALHYKPTLDYKPLYLREEF